MRHLTPEEISNVESKALSLQHLRNQNQVSIGGQLTAIMNLSPQHGLILIYGNEDTGFEHIRVRHELYSGKSYWKYDDPENISLAYPSKFSPQSIPIFTYVELADALYRPEFFNLSNNKSPELFDLYDGQPDIGVAENRRYKLVLYKGTKIIHTLYPTNEKYTQKKPKGFALRKGGVSVNHDIMNGLVKVTIPYFDHQKVKCFSVIHSYEHITHQLNKKIIIHRAGKADLELNYDPEPFEGDIDASGFLVMQYEAAELKELETEIARLQADKQNWINIP